MLWDAFNGLIPASHAFPGVRVLCTFKFSSSQFQKYRRVSENELPNMSPLGTTSVIVIYLALSEIELPVYLAEEFP